MAGVRSWSAGGSPISRQLLVIGIVLGFAVSALSVVGAGVLTPTAPGGTPPVAAAPHDGLSTSVTPSFPTPIQHVVVVVDENQNYSTVLADGPFENYLAQNYATATEDYSIAHGSTHAYQATTSGAANNSWPNPSKNIGDLADAAGVSWDAFEQGMPTVCDKTLNWADGYDNDHNPFIMFSDIANNKTRCDAHDLTWSSWTTDIADDSLPNYSFVTPNTTNDDHNGTSQMEEIRNGDAWLQSWLSPLINDSAIFSNTAFLITFDEDAGNNKITPPVDIRGQNASGGHIYMVIVSPYSKDLTSSTYYTTFSVLTTAEWLLGIPGGTLPGGNDSWTLNPPMTGLFSFPPTSYSVTFTESGLPSGTNWSATLNGVVENSTTSTISFTEPNGTYAYTAGAVTGYSPSPASGSVSVSGLPVGVSISYSPEGVETYAVTLKETGLPSGTSWSAKLAGVTEGSTTSTIVFTEPNGTYAYTATVPGSGTASGSLTVAGAKLTLTIPFEKVTIKESGLASGTSWSTLTNGVSSPSTTSTIVFYLTAGTYSFTATVTGSGSITGTFTVSTKALTVTVQFIKATFAEKGLKSGTSWSATMDGFTLSTTSTTLVFYFPTGTYAYTVSATGYSAKPASGSLTLSGANVWTTVTFKATG
ncbi:MAG: alkaline phosphatase family protein [Thermoplasmata archaeon]